MAFNFGLLNALIGQTGLGKVGFAEKYGFKYDTLTRWTYNGANPNEENVEKLAAALGVSVDFLYLNNDEVQLQARQAALMRWSVQHLEGEREVKDEHIDTFEQWILDKADSIRSRTKKEELPSAAGTSPLERPVEAIPPGDSTLAPELKNAELATEGDNS